MTLLTHLVWTDVRRYRLLIAVYVVTVVAATGLAIVQPITTANPRTLAATGLAGTLLWMTRALLTLVIVPLVVQAHSLVGSDAFWMTRPIPPRKLLASKIVLLAVLIVAVPVVCELAFMSIYNVPAARMALVATQTALFQALWMVVVMSAASLTRNLAGFALLCGGALIAFALVIVLVELIFFNRIGEGSAVAVLIVDPPPLAPDLSDSTPDILFAVLLLAAGLALLLVQYRARSRQRSVPTAVAGVVLAWALGSVWPWPVFKPQLVVPEWALTRDALRLTADPTTVKFEVDSGWARLERQWRHARARVRLSGLAPGWRADVRLAGASLEIRDGVRVASRGTGWSEAVPVESTGENQHRAVMRGVLDVSRLDAFGHAGAQDVIVMVIRASDISAYGGAAGTYTGTFFVDLTRVEIAATLPLRQGATYQHEADRFVIDEVRPAPGLSGIARVRRSSATTMFDRRPPSSYTLYLRNQRRREATIAPVRPLRENLFLRPLSTAGFSVGIAQTFGFAVNEELVFRYPPSDGREEAVFIDDGWLADAALVIVRTTRQGSVVRTLAMSGFQIPAAQRQ